MMHRAGWEGRKANSGMAFAWFVWDRAHRGPATIDRLHWDQYDGADDFAKSIDEAYRVIRERKAAGGKGWQPKDYDHAEALEKKERKFNDLLREYE
jgi:hypothetical protein